MEPRLLALMQNQGVDATLLDKMGDAGLTSLNVFACLGGSRDKFVEVLEKPPLDIKATDFAGSLEQAKLLAAWEAANTMKEVETKHTAERQVQRLPPQLQLADIESATKVFEAAEHPLTKFTTPSKALFELLQGQVEAYYEPISLIHVTSLDNQDVNNTSTYGIDLASGLLRATAQKPYAIPMPKTP